MTNIELPAGILIDMDGVLVDSEGIITEAASLMFAEKGVVIDPGQVQKYVGTGEEVALSGLAKEYGIEIDVIAAKTRVHDIYLNLIKGRLKAFEGGREFIAACRCLGKKIALATSSDMRKTTGNLTEVGLGFELFDAIVTGDEIEKTKPAPDIFLVAAEKLGLKADQCLVIEDAVTGLKAAKAAGARCLAITSSFSKEQLAGADYFAASLAEVDIAKISW